VRVKVAALLEAGWFQAILWAVGGALTSVLLASLLLFLWPSTWQADSNAQFAALAAVFSLLVMAPLCFWLGLTLKRLDTANRQLADAVARDSLTSCLNSGVFSAMVDAHPTLTGSRDGRRNGALLIVGVDFLGTINDEAGHRAGDDALRLVAGIVRASVRKGDLVGRIAGQQFSLFLPGATRDDALGVAERIRSAVSRTQLEAAGAKWPLSVSVGAVLFEHQIELDQLMRMASRQLDIAKESGRNRVAHTRLDSDDRDGSGPVLH
jgi:diguanylate cyclase